jgi:hypothetical protein
MPRSQIQSSLLSNAVRTLFDRHQVDAAGTDAPLAFVLGDRGGAWTIDDVLPVSILLGWRAPPSSWALVVVASGTARWLGPDAAAPAGATSAAPGAAAAAPGATAAAPGATAAAPAGAAAGAPAGTDAAGSAAVVVSGPGAGPGGAAATGPPLPLGLAVGMTRSGETTGRFAGGEAITDPTPHGGRLLDTLRRNLGVVTPPAPEGTARLLAVAWLAAIRTATGIRPAPAGRASEGRPLADRGLGWPAVLRLHPAARLLSARGEHLSTAELEEVVEIALSTWTWDVLRRAESSNGSIVPLCPPGTASWMDGGMYARWVLTDLPPTASVWRLVRPVLSPVARRRLQRWFERDGVDLDSGVDLHEGDRRRRRHQVR